jgi:kinesin family protein 4/21/27
MRLFYSFFFFFKKVFAYGQTGSGKTYTMGSAFPQEENTHYRGVIPQAMEAIFSRISEIQGSEFTIRVGFVEIHKEEIRDLLAKRQNSNVLIRELPAGGIVLAGTVEKEVRTQEEMIHVLEEGTSLRATAATGMNKTSSRSHAIFTITIEQRKTRADRPDSPAANSSDDEEEEDDLGLDDYLCAKMHLVDLAGSERVKRTKAQGQRLQEGININKGLLALGNVINALSEGKGHVPYRDSKLTRMLQDSLGGNSRTVMIACVSPADVNLEESLNTLRYANRARAIKNKPMVNRDPVAAQIAALRQQLAATKTENLELRKKLGMSPTDEMEFLADDGSSEELARALRDSESRVAALQRELVEARAEAELLREELKGATEAQLIASLQRDKVASVLAATTGQEAAAAALAEAGVPPGEATTERVLANKAHELEDELRRLRISRIRSVAAGVGTPGSPSLSASPLSPGAMSKGGVISSSFSPTFSSGDGTGFEGGEIDAELIAEEQAHRETMARVQSEMDILQQQLESKEAAIAAVSNHSTMKATYETQLREIEAERDALATERVDLLSKLRALQAASSEERIRMERMYKERIRELDTKVKGIDLKERKIRDLEGAKRRAMDSVSTLKSDVQRIKEQKAVLQKQSIQTAKEFNVWKKEQTKEVMHLKKEKRANAAQLMRMEALHSKQLEVLRRKTEEAAAARKRLQLLEGRRGARSKNSGAPEGSISTGRPRSGSLGGTGVARPADSGSEATFNGATAAAGGGGGNAAGVNATSPAVVAAAMADEPTRREWVESELDTCCSSYELQKVLEGEKAMRSEAARQLREVERRLAALKNPQWWGSSSTGAASEREGGEDILLKKSARLATAAEKHGRQIQEIQLALIQARAREEERGGGAADPTRWSSIAASNEVRTMLTTVFRSASQYKAQAYEAQLAMTEMSEEVEMLRLKLEVSDAEKLEAAMQAAEAQATAEALAASQQGGHPTTEDTPRQPVSVISDVSFFFFKSALARLKHR